MSEKQMAQDLLLTRNYLVQIKINNQLQLTAYKDEQSMFIINYQFTKNVLFVYIKIIFIKYDAKF